MERWSVGALERSINIAPEDCRLKLAGEWRVQRNESYQVLSGSECAPRRPWWRSGRCGGPGSRNRVPMARRPGRRGGYPRTPLPGPPAPVRPAPARVRGSWEAFVAPGCTGAGAGGVRAGSGNHPAVLPCCGNDATPSDTVTAPGDCWPACTRRLAMPRRISSARCCASACVAPGSISRNSSPP